MLFIALSTDLSSTVNWIDGVVLLRASLPMSPGLHPRSTLRPSEHRSLVDPCRCLPPIDRPRCVHTEPPAPTNSPQRPFTTFLTGARGGGAVSAVSAGCPEEEPSFFVAQVENWWAGPCNKKEKTDWLVVSTHVENTSQWIRSSSEYKG